MREQKKRKKGARSIGREMAFQVLYGSNFLKKMPLDDYFKMIDHFSEDISNSLNPRAVKFAKELIEGTLNHLDEIDKIIESYSKNWKLSRIGKIELTILRLEIFEMMFRDDIPPKVAIDEGVELSKKFGDERSKRFVNGILDAVARSIKDELQTSS